MSVAKATEALLGQSVLSSQYFLFFFGEKKKFLLLHNPLHSLTSFVFTTVSP